MANGQDIAVTTITEQKIIIAVGQNKGLEGLQTINLRIRARAWMYLTAVSTIMKMCQVR